jgi:hypothetical protein
VTSAAFRRRMAIQDLFKKPAATDTEISIGPP